MKQGLIYYLNTTTGRFVVELANFTYTIFETSNVKAFSMGDVVTGNLSQTGTLHILNTSTQSMEMVLIHNIGCTLELALEIANSNLK